MAAATVLLSAQPFRLPGVDARLSISDAASDQKVEGDFDLEMMMLDGYISHNYLCFFIVDLCFHCSPGAGKLAGLDGRKKFCKFVV